MTRRGIMAAIAATALFAGSAMAQEQEPRREGPPPMVPIATPVQPLALPLYAKAPPPMADAARAENWGTFDKHYRVVRNVTVPTITPYLPHSSKATGAAVIVAPGGGFMMLAIDAEGEMVARWLAERGVAAFVLKYRVQPTPADPAAFERASQQRMGEILARPDRLPVFQPALDDGIAAMRLVRSRAGEWGIDPNRVGMIGFSAGAMTTLGVTLANQPDAQPNFIGLIYGQMGSVTLPANAPPLFAALAADDPLFGRDDFGLIDSWRKANRPVEFHFYQNGSHGFGMRAIDATATLWPEQFLSWMKVNKLLAAPQ